MRRLLLPMLVALALPTAARAHGVEVANPRAAGMDPDALSKVDAIINAAIRKQVTPGAALAISRNGQLVRLRGYGKVTYGRGAPAASQHTLYDLASLTKSVGTTSAVMLLVQQGRLELDLPLAQYFPEWEGALDRAGMTARHLLRHTSGLPPGGELSGVGRDRERIPGFMARVRLLHAPGTRYEYSDYGMILLGALVERIAGERLDSFLDRHLFDPAQMRETGFRPLDWGRSKATSSFRLAAQRPSIAPTERTRSRGHIRGVVHDPLAYRLDGVAGHAGLFSTAADMARFADLVLHGGRIDDQQIFAPDVVEMFTRRPSDRARFALGWELAREGGPSGQFFPSTAFGHTGFTGTSLWIDREHDLYVVLLTNRLDPNASESRHAKLRRDVHDAVQRALIS